MTPAQTCHEHMARCLAHTHATAMDRRRFLQAAAIALGAALAGMAGLQRTALGAGGTEAMLLSCMDYRLMDDIVKYMDKRQLTNKYDHVILAGASLGAQTDKFPAWNKTFWEHLDVAIQLHHIQKVILLDHRDCGAYKVVLGKDFGKMPEEETAVHTAQLRALEKAIRQKHPKLSIDMLLMDLNGRVQMIS